MSVQDFTDEEVRNFAEKYEITVKRVREYIDMFGIIDEDKSGKITTEEFRNMVAKHIPNASQSEVKTLLSDLDENDDGEVDFDEFLKIIVPVNEGRTSNKAKLINAFRSLDKNKTGLISTSELQDILKHFAKKLDRKDRKKLIRAADPDECGEIDYLTFIDLIVP
mmetsp:Transcript_13327/g.17467  ORF Transcript_13327/g.17467 Transcript_13327/m.17467 type:complete len:165 (+) Transcript_13327:215-709(+)|eukprot:CAMPEP_0116066992 /NCGR_PEP_ID=MMETSP0322-20121206/10736_1 /TAXON_ID=163516 /ORGANISM="Leptocylindrus danicus var. apora, Strain B651" /LENGTH=164 /DNA_ID=CAMNT_0003553699 /DNA_START=176 /DNA_END=670 /DNA_ORIENTATION=+